MAILGRLQRPSPVGSVRPCDTQCEVVPPDPDSTTTQKNRFLGGVLSVTNNFFF